MFLSSLVSRRVHLVLRARTILFTISLGVRPSPRDSRTKRKTPERKPRYAATSRSSGWGSRNTR
jgi:hypothetical protein